MVALIREELGCLRLPLAQRRQARVSCRALDTLKQPWKVGKNTLGRLHPPDHHPSLTVSVLRGISFAPHGPLWTQGSLQWWELHVCQSNICLIQEHLVSPEKVGWAEHQTEGGKEQWGANVQHVLLEGSSLQANVQNCWLEAARGLPGCVLRTAPGWPRRGSACGPPASYPTTCRDFLFNWCLLFHKVSDTDYLLGIESPHHLLLSTT